MDHASDIRSSSELLETPSPQLGTLQMSSPYIRLYEEKSFWIVILFRAGSFPLRTRIALHHVFDLFTAGECSQRNHMFFEARGGDDTPKAS